MIKYIEKVRNRIIEVYKDSVLVFKLEREDDGKGVWALYRVDNGVVGKIIDRDPLRVDLFENIESELY